MKKVFILWLLLQTTQLCNAQLVDIISNQATNGNSFLGISSYAANECIYTESEIGTGNFITSGTAITHISYNIATIGTNTVFSNVSIYMKDISSNTNFFTASGAYDALNTYTQVFNGSITLSAIGWKEIELTTPFVRTAGSNLKILIIRNDGVAHSNFNYYCSNGYNNVPTANTIKRYTGTSPVTNSTTLSLFATRQAIRLAHKYNNDAKVNGIYTLGKLPIPHNASQVIKANVTNLGINTLTNLNATLTISGANAFTNTQTIASLAPGASTTVSFSTTTFSNLGNNNITVSVANDDDNSNNAQSQNLEVTNNTWTYAVGTNMSAGFGFTNNTGDIVTKFNTTLPSLISQVSMFFYNGGQNYKVGIWDASGANGTPGNLLWESSLQTSLAGQNLLSVSPVVNIASGDFYVGIRQTGNTNVGLAFQTENPVRTQTFYYASPSGSTTWYDFAPSSPYRFMIEPVLQQTCVSTPVSATVTGPSSICAGNGFTLSSFGFTIGTNISYQWESSPSGQNNWSPISGATNIVYNVPTQTGNIDYRFLTTCNTTNSSNPSNVLTVNETPYYNCYCSSTATNSTNEEIYSVTVNGDNSNTLSGQGNGCSTVAPGVNSVLSRYANFKTLGALTTIKRGATVSFTIAENECDGAPYNSFGTSLFIDYNHNGSFADNGEQVYVENSTALGPRNITNSFLVPTNAALGLTGMRVIVAEGISGAGLTPCISYGYGETEDYLININACPFDTAIISASNSNICIGSLVTFTAAPASNGIALSYQWLLNGNAINGATNSTYTNSTLNNGDLITVNATNTCGNQTTSAGINMIVSSNSNTSNSITACDSYTWNLSGQTYTNSGTYTVSNGCHTDVLHLTITPTNTSNYSVTACDNYTWNINSQNYTTSGTYTETNGCHTDILNLTVTPSTTNTTTVNACDSFTWSINGQTYYASGIYSATNGCHTELLNLTINQSYTTTSTISSCNSYLWAANGQTYTTSGTYTAVNACHTEILNLTISPITNNVTVITACNNYLWQVTGLTYTQSGIYTAYINCNVEVLDLTIPQNTIISDTVTVCGAYTWPLNGQTYTNSGIYNVINGCTTNRLVLMAYPIPTVFAGQNVQVCIGNTVTLSGSGAQTYAWSNGIVDNQTFTPSTSQTYSVVGTDINGCTDTDLVTVSVLPLPIINAGNDINTCYGTSVTLNAVANATISWSNGITNNQPFNAYNSGNIVATATTALGCTNSDTLYLNILALPNINGGQDQSVCAGHPITLHATGGNSLSWDNNVIDNQSFIPLTNNNYVVSGVGVNGCSNTDTVNVSVYSAPPVNAGNDIAVCPGTSIVLSASGALTYSWSGGITNNQNFIPTNSASYVVSGTDAFGCVNSDTVQVTLLPLPIAIVNNYNKSICVGGNTTVTASGGVTYLWSNGDTSATTNLNQASNYTVIATNAYGCSDVSDTVYVKTKTLPSIVILTNINSTCEGNSIPVYLNPTTNVSGFDVQWYSSNSPIVGETNTTYYATASGSYLLKVSGGSNCTNASNSKTVSIIPKPVAIINTSGSPNLCAGGKVVLIAGLPTAYSSYKWLKDGVTVTAAKTYKVTAPGIYQLTVLKNGCADTSDPVVVNIYNKPVSSISSSVSTICSGDSTQLAASPVVVGYSYQWVLGQTLIANATSTSYFAQAAGSYKVIITNTGCSGISPVYKIVVNNTPSPTIVPQSSTTIALNGSVKLLATYYAGAAYQWYKDGNTIAGATKRDYKAIAGGDYSVSVTKNNCFGVAAPITVIQTNVKEINGNTNSETESFELVAYPNPASEYINLEVRGATTEEATITILDVFGNKVNQQILTNSNQVSIDISNFASGYYLLQYQDKEGNKASLKFIKE